jgi:regulator of cell morphogenesis and NO signaling
LLYPSLDDRYNYGTIVGSLAFCNAIQTDNMNAKEDFHITTETQISDVILNNPYIILLLEHFGLDMPLQEKSVNDICSENNINTRLFITFTNLYNGIQHDFVEPFSLKDTLTIIDYLRNSHRYYSEEIYPNILETIRLLKSTNKNKEMDLVERFFDEYMDEVAEHFRYENDIVFPYVTALYEKLLDSSHQGSLRLYSVEEYKVHHDDIQEKLNDLKNLLIKYLPQKNDRTIRRKLLFSLSELEYDLNIHSKIEDYILIPMVAHMELELKG